MRRWSDSPDRGIGVTRSTLSGFWPSPGSRAGVAPLGSPGTVVANSFPSVPHYPIEVRAVTASLRDAAGAGRRPLARPGRRRRGRGGGAHRAAASRWRPRCASAPSPWPPSPRPRACARGPRRPRRVLVYVGALAVVGLVVVRVDRLVADAAVLLRRRQPLARRPRPPRPAASCSRGLLRRPLESAVWVLCAASLPLVAYAIQQRAHGVFFQTSPRLQGVLGYPNAIGAYAALAAPARALARELAAARRAAPPAAARSRCSCSASGSPPRAAACSRR